jgi:rRNA-processing protein FCF1
MHNSYVIETSSVETLTEKPLLLDTNFIIDAIIFREEAVGLIAQLREINCELLTTRSVVVETLGGTKNETDLKAKVVHLELLFGKKLDKIVSLPIERDLPEIKSLLDYSRQCNKFGTTDFELFLTLKKYKHAGIMLVTRNHLDFTGRLFNRQGFITLLGNKEIRTYGLYTAR